MHLTTVFAGQDGEATERARGYFTGYAPSSPQIALMKDGEIVFMLERWQIEGRSAGAIAEDLVRGVRRVLPLTATRSALRLRHVLCIPSASIRRRQSWSVTLTITLRSHRWSGFHRRHERRFGASRQRVEQEWEAASGPAWAARTTRRRALSPTWVRRRTEQAKATVQDKFGQVKDKARELQSTLADRLDAGADKLRQRQHERHPRRCYRRRKRRRGDRRTAWRTCRTPSRVG